MPESNQPQTNNQEVHPDGYLKERDIQRLFILAKIAMFFIGLVASLAIIFSYQNAKDIKTDLAAEADLLRQQHKDKLNEMNAEIYQIKAGLSEQSKQLRE